MINKDAKWLAAYDTELSSPLFRKEFYLEEKPEKAELSICGLGYQVTTINGKNITDDVLSTPFTKFDSTVFYNVYDVTDLLKVGMNATGVMLGNGLYNDITETWDFSTVSWRHHPKFIFSLKITLKSNESIYVLSDTSWKSSEGPIKFNHSRHGERYDSRDMKLGFDIAGFDDSEWQNVKICHSPGGVLKENIYPQIKIIEELPMKEIFTTVFDCGQNISGWVKIKVKGKSGDKIKIRYSERCSEEGQLDTRFINTFNLHDLSHTDEYICYGDNDFEEWQPHFCYHGFRYVEIIGNVELLDIVACVVHTELKTIGGFKCSDEMLNKIHDASVWSIRTNYHSVPTDCPHREQMGWTGDAQISAEQSLMNFDMLSVYEKYLNDFKDVQRPSGQLPGLLPTGGWGFNWGSGPAWDSAVILIPLYVWRYTRDIRIVKNMWENMKRYMEYIYTMEEDGIVDFGLEDWNRPKRTPMCPVAITDTAFYYADACAMAELAQVIEEDPTEYQNLAKRIRCSFRKKFIKNGHIYPQYQTAYACALYYGLFDKAEESDAVLKLVELVKENDYHFNCGIMGIKYILSVLSEHGYEDVVYKAITNPTYPSYAYWINKGATTLCETWEMTHSLNHHMYSSVDLWFYRYLAGIKCDSDELIIEPKFLEKIDYVDAYYRDIKVFWNKDIIRVTVPTPAKLILGNKIINISNGVSTYTITGDIIKE